MKPLLAIIYLLSFSAAVFPQYYLRGEVRDEQNHPLPNIRINFFSKGTFPYYTGSNGGFGIPSHLKTDTISIIADGYEYLRAPVRSAQYEIFTLKMTSVKANSSKLRLSSLTKNLLTERLFFPVDNGESYSSTVENVFIDARLFPQTGFALNVDRASYSNIRRFLNSNSEVPPDAVRIEEMLNYFNFRLKTTEEKKGVFEIRTAFTSCPWNSAHQLLFINLQAGKISLEKTPPSNLVFLIDVSGSMDMPNRLPLLKTGFKLLAENLRNIDTVSIISYANGVSVMLQPTSGDEKQKIVEAIEGLTPSGATSGEAAIRTAYKYAEHSFIKGGNNRVILATDGDFNVGMTSERELEELITKQKQSGIYLTCLGVGMGNYKDSKLEALAKKGDGNFAYLDNEREAEKVLVEEFSQTLLTVANDVFLNVDFNPSLVQQYRLIGFENKQSAIADSISQLEGGEIGSGHNLLAVFEIIPAEKTISNVGNTPSNLASLKLSYKIPATNELVLSDHKVPSYFKEISSADPTLKFASSVIMFGALLKQSKFNNDVSFDDIIALGLSSADSSNGLQKEFIELVQKAKKIYSKRRKKSGTSSAK